MAVYAGTTLSYFRHPDWLGSSRLASNVDQTVHSDTAYAPFGEPYAESGTTDRSFTGQNQDTVQGNATGLYDFLYRELALYGRWLSPDPAGRAAVDPSNPQSWNRYAYVNNSPMGAVDALGLACIMAMDGGDGRPYGRGCGGGGGFWGRFAAMEDAGMFDGGVGYGPGGDNGTAVMGNDLFDALAGAPGTYMTKNMYGGIGWGFSIDKWYFDWAGIEATKGETPLEKMILKARSDCAGENGLGDRTIEWQLMNSGGKEFWIFEHLDRSGRIVGSPFGSQISRGEKLNWFTDWINALAPYGVWNQTFSASTNPNNPTGSPLELRDYRNKAIQGNTISQRIVQGNPGYVEVNGRRAPSLAPCSGREPKG